MDAMAATRPHMIATLDTFRDTLDAIARSDRWKAGAAAFKGAFILLLGLGILINVAIKIRSGVPPSATLMLGFGGAALAANLRLPWPAVAIPERRTWTWRARLRMFAQRDLQLRRAYRRGTGRGAQVPPGPTSSSAWRWRRWCYDRRCECWGMRCPKLPRGSRPARSVASAYSRDNWGRPTCKAGRHGIHSMTGLCYWGNRPRSPSPRRNRGPDRFDHAERPRSLKEAIGRAQKAGPGEAQDPPRRSFLQRIANQHQGDGDKAEPG